ncbi:hypothetical protein OG594_11490 [Streptomyces sp. NBC_01214]|uniref:hypothetical protein n=1 Tax=Streptomyces sp. NBC_01214 TaxID=2903777 RepID=UPI00225832F0|nr:hypothetical protein [Streptomyces sp. NBC_01214]MCX4802271.1 hypothetical protein [Streptomyces sp. NBC_01214]
MADVFACAGCGAGLTASLTRVALPVRTHQRYGHDLLPALMEQGTYAVDPEPSGPPWRPWDAIGADEAAARGVFAPVPALSSGLPGAILVAPGDTRGTVLIPERCDGYCLGLDGRAGPNLACAQCGRAVATRMDDCTFWQVVRLDPTAVHRIPSGGPDPTADWAEIIRDREPAPPIEPPGRWSPQWQAAVAVALAHLLAASGGNRVSVPAGPLATAFGRALDGLLPAGPTAKTLALAGPGLPAPATDIVLVPQHPQTGEAWEPPPGAAGAVPLAADVWTYLAFHDDRRLVPATGVLPDGVLRDDPLPHHPWGVLRPDARVLLHTLSRLPAVREPWLRAIHDRLSDRPS